MNENELSRKMYRSVHRMQSDNETDREVRSRYMPIGVHYREVHFLQKMSIILEIWYFVVLSNKYDDIS
jgi:hypothetical protein